jgi:hypothetical protein
MTDQTTTQIVQVHPSWFDWITVAALMLGPVFALFAQRLLDFLREKKNRRVNLYQTVMSLRAVWLNPDSVRALNSIDTIFDKPSDKPVREAWTAVIARARNAAARLEYRTTTGGGVEQSPNGFAC